MTQKHVMLNIHFERRWSDIKVSETPIVSEDARGRGSEVVFPLHVRKISPLRTRKTKLDPCSSGTSLRNTANFTNLFSQFIMLPKWKPFSGARHVMLNIHFERRWSDIKFQRPPSSQKILGREGLKCQVLVNWPKSHATFLHRRSIQLASADLALYSKTLFA